MLSGFPPFPGDDHKDIIKGVMKCDIKFDQDEWKNCSDEGKKFILKFLQKQAKNRISLQEALDDPWLKESTTRIRLDLATHRQLVYKIEDFAQSNIFTKAIKLYLSKI